MNAYYLLLVRPKQFDKGAIHNGIINTYTIKVEGVTTPSPLCQIQNVKPSHRHGNTSDKTLLLSETWVERYNTPSP